MFQSGSEGRAAQQCAVLTRLLSPLLANIALSVLDEHLHAAVAAQAAPCPPASNAHTASGQGPTELADRPIRR